MPPRHLLYTLNDAVLFRILDIRAASNLPCFVVGGLFSFDLLQRIVEIPELILVKESATNKVVVKLLKAVAAV